MEFKEVHDYINQDSTEQNPSSCSLDQIDQANPYNALFQSAHRKPTLSNFVHRLRQQSSKTRFVREYKKMASLFDTTHHDSVFKEKSHSDSEDDASLRISDPNRKQSHDTDVVQLMIQHQKKPLKRVFINESANQICYGPIPTTTTPSPPNVNVEAYMSLPEALDRSRRAIQSLVDQIEFETERIRLYQEQIERYQNQCHWMDSQLDTIHASFQLFYRDNLPEMKAQKERMIQNELRVRIHQKKHKAQRQRFEKYPKLMNMDTRLAELKQKITVAWQRDEFWLGIRDWGLLSVILIVLIVTTILKIH